MHRRTYQCPRRRCNPRGLRGFQHLTAHIQARAAVVYRRCLAGGAIGKANDKSAAVRQVAVVNWTSGR